MSLNRSLYITSIFKTLQSMSQNCSLQKKNQYSSCPVNVTKLFIITISIFKTLQSMSLNCSLQKTSIFKLSSACHLIVHYKNINIQTLQSISLNCSLKKNQYSSCPVHVTKLFIITISIFKLSSPCH